MKFRIFPILLLLLLSAPGQLYPQTSDNAKMIKSVENGLTLSVRFADSALTSYNILERMKFYKVPSVSITVINGGKIAWSKAYGYSDLKSKSPATINTMYQVASISKSVNAFFILKLVQEGKLSLDDDIRNLLKSWVFPDNLLSINKKITLRNLLSHTAGISTPGFFGYKINENLPALNEILNGQKPANNDTIKPIFIPGSKFFYSGGGITITRKIIEDCCNSDYCDLIGRMILEPLKMRHSTYQQNTNTFKHKIALGYLDNFEQVEGGHHLFPELAPDGLWSTSKDIAKIIVSLQKSLNGKTSLLSKEMASTMLSPILKSSNYALGVTVDGRSKERYFSHKGANYGYRSVFYGNETSGNGVVILTNSETGEELINEIANSVALVYKWNNFYTPPEKKLISIPEAILNKYVGKFVTGDAIFLIRISNGQLQMTGGGTERLYPISKTGFFLISDPTADVVFISSKNNGIFDTLEIGSSGTTLIRAKKQK